MLHLVKYFAEQIFVWNRSWLCTTDKSYYSRWYDSYQAFQCNMMLLAWIKGIFNGEEGLGEKCSVQSVMHRIIRYIRLRVSGILLSNRKFRILLNLPNWNTSRWKIHYVYPCYGITQHCRFERVKCHMRISVCLQFTKYGLVFVWHVVTANTYGKGVFTSQLISKNMCFLLLIFLDRFLKKRELSSWAFLPFWVFN